MVVIPVLDLIVVATSDGEVYPDSADEQELSVLQIISENIIPAVIK